MKESNGRRRHQSIEREQKVSALKPSYSSHPESLIAVNLLIIDFKRDCEACHKSQGSPFPNIRFGCWKHFRFHSR
ncbi:hypothetical protein TNCT_118131 [Trichonephila clavata]|uniref:Uncharacterized protein n=1 Tax=Trichonephila clavata TaxID=2740835 RepID=A0A8X6IR04_TRICU|nr:hypothetical protein TNCT_118131 [Trichonephila clavata]